MVWLASLFILSAIHVFGLVFQVGGSAFELVRGDILNIPPILLAAWIIYLVSKHQSDPMKRMWFWLSIGLFFLGLGDCIWAYLEIVLKIDPFPSIADIFYVLEPIAIVSAFSNVPRNRIQTKRENLKLSLEIAIVMTTVIILAWHLYLANTVLAYGQQYLELALSLTYPLMDVLLLTTLSLLMFNGRGRLSQIQFSGLALGLAGLGLYDILFNIQEANNSYITGTPTDAFQTLSALLFGIAAVLSLRPERKPVLNSEVSDTPKRVFWSTWRTLAIITQICLITVFLVYILSKHDQSIREIGVMIGSGLILALALVRQFVELSDNSELNRSLRRLSKNLEQRVIERTKELNAKTVQLQESQAQLVASEKLINLGRFTASVAHEVNTPLAASLYDLSHAKELVLEYKNSIIAPNVTPDDHLEIANELEATHQRIESSLERLGRFIRRVREQSRMSSTNSTDFDARQTLQDTFAHLEYQASEHQVKLEINLPDEPVLIHGDPHRLGQILNELVHNGIQACSGQFEKGSSWIHIALSASPETANLSVENNGLGINSDALADIFEPLLSNTFTEQSTGLGLSVVHDIVKGHFLGDIRVNSQGGQGTRFDITLPKSKPRQENS
jgi:signal transduction histidine kinase